MNSNRDEDSVVSIDLSGKTALVTGGVRGIGKAISLTLAKAGANIVVTYLSSEALAVEMVKEIIEDFSVNCRAIQMNVRDARQIRAEMSSLFRESQLDILVNNAGINEPADFDKVELASFMRILETNLMGPWIVTQEALQYMRNGGSIIFIGSLSAELGGPRSVHYAASKHGLEAITRGVARFVADRNIRSNLVVPGYIRSPMAESGSISPAVRQLLDQIPLGKRMGEAQEVANVVAFLASDLASYITGATVHVNGGLYFG